MRVIARRRKETTRWGYLPCPKGYGGARGENRLRKQARTRKTQKDRSAQVRDQMDDIAAGQRHLVDNFMTYVPGSSASTIPGSEPPSRNGVT
ncbi:hypothetical protein SLA_0843 [Streptomyces laurentii]|uniref:Uncharacterized protein n=1 Tax=Streptomyces laurentii TaxID=39478 RepID=A0A160NTH8_STRLU|nr:hypothetical protein SLA_0843 [Streptomyces laurentii]